MQQSLSIWITGSTRSGKTTRLVKKFRDWVQQKQRRLAYTAQLSPAALVFAANDSQRRELADRLAAAVRGSYPVVSKTPLGFISDEVMLFWPLIFEQLKLKAQFPLRLRPETEQELATRLWRKAWQPQKLQLSGRGEYRLIRQTLDLLQLAGAAGIAAESITEMLWRGLPEEEWEHSCVPTEAGEVPLWQYMGEFLLDWQKWCLERGLLSYGIIYELYWRYLLPDPTYEYHLTRRYQAIFADDTDDYPAIAADLSRFLLEKGAWGVFTYNPQGGVRLGLNADPQYVLTSLSPYCQPEILGEQAMMGLAGELGEIIPQVVTGEALVATFPENVQSLQATSRSSLLRETAAFITKSIQQGKIQPREIAIIAPGLDEIARYSLLEILSHQNIAVEPLNEQRPLSSYPLIRALLTLLCFIYPGLGRITDRDAVAEMLVILSRNYTNTGKMAAIDPVRAGLLADNCYQPDLDTPRLVAVESFPRWDRLGHQATKAYQEILNWIEQERPQTSEALPRVINILDKGIKHFLQGGTNLAYNQLSALRELMETAQHYWEVERRLRQNETSIISYSQAIAQFIQLLRRGTITANAYPITALNEPNSAITLATIFQYRSSRLSHRWHFWLDASSSLWAQGGAANLFASHLFLQDWPQRPLLPEERAQQEEARLGRILQDLLSRVDERVILCHSDLAVNGKEQNGPLLGLVHAATITVV